MRIKDYQEEAQLTDQVRGTSKDEKAIMVPLLGLAGEAGTLLTEYKKRVREGPAYTIFKERIAEEIGDILWYVANIASKEGLDLEEIAQENLDKVKSRWLPADNGSRTTEKLFDERFPATEQFPRIFRIEIVELKNGDRVKIGMTMNGRALGDPLTDNAYEEDGYRYHDIFHLAYTAMLGWSPVIRKLMRRKRKSNPRTDEVEDGGRAAAIEEGISALVFDYARDHSFLENINHVDYGILRIIKQLTKTLEVSQCSENQWQEAILNSFAVWRQFMRHRQGVIIGNLLERTIEFELLAGNAG